MNLPRTHRGYIALISVLAISFTLMVFAVLAAENGLLARANTSAYEDRLTAVHFANSCAFAALLMTAQDASYHPDPPEETIALSPEESCIVEEAKEVEGLWEVRARGKFNASFSRLTVNGMFSSTSKPVFIEWEEL